MTVHVLERWSTVLNAFGTSLLEHTRASTLNKANKRVLPVASRARYPIPLLVLASANGTRAHHVLAARVLVVRRGFPLVEVGEDQAP